MSYVLQSSAFIVCIYANESIRARVDFSDPELRFYLEAKEKPSTFKDSSGTNEDAFSMNHGLVFVVQETKTKTIHGL